MTQATFKPHRTVQETQHPYGLITGEAAVRVLEDFNRFIGKSELVRAGYVLKDVLKIVKTEEHPDGVLAGSTPDALMVLLHYVPTRDCGFTIATPQQMAQIYNSDSEFIRNKFWADVLLIRNPHADLSKPETRVPWMMELSEQVDALIGKGEVVAIPYFAVVPATRSNGHLGNSSGYVLADNARDLVQILKWGKEDVQGFSFDRLSEENGVPKREDHGKRRFYGLSGKLFSGLCLDWGLGLYSDGGGLAGSGSSGRVVGWSVGEADARKN